MCIRLHRGQAAVPGLDRENVYNVMDVDSGRTPVKGKVVVCGGGVSGCECALQLAYDGNDVTVVDMLPADQFAAGLEPDHPYHAAHAAGGQRREAAGRPLRAGDQRPGRGGCRTGTGKKTLLEADYVVEAFGMKSTRPSAEEYRALIPEVYIVGDANEVKNIKKANFDAYNLACNV